MPDRVRQRAIKVAVRASRLTLQTQQRIDGLTWEVGLLRKTVGHAADLLGRAEWKHRERGDVWKLAHVKRIARIFAASGDGERRRR